MFQLSFFIEKNTLVNPKKSLIEKKLATPFDCITTHQCILFGSSHKRIGHVERSTGGAAFLDQIAYEGRLGE